MIKIYIDNQQCDTFEDLQVGISIALSDIEDFTSVKANKSTAFKLPLTNRNKAILNYESLITKSKGSYIFTGRIDYYGFVFEGDCELLNIGNVDGLEYADLQIVSDVGVFSNLIKNLSLKDLDFSEYNHQYNLTNIQAATLAGTTYTYPLVNLGAWDGSSVNIIGTGNGANLFYCDKKHALLSGDILLIDGETVTVSGLSGDYGLGLTGWSGDIVGKTGYLIRASASNGTNRLVTTDFYPTLPIKTILDKICSSQGYILDYTLNNSTVEDNAILFNPRDINKRESVDLGDYYVEAQQTTALSLTSSVRAKYLVYDDEISDSAGALTTFTTPTNYTTFQAQISGKYRFSINISVAGGTSSPASSAISFYIGNFGSYVRYFKGIEEEDSTVSIVFEIYCSFGEIIDFYADCVDFDGAPFVGVTSNLKIEYLGEYYENDTINMTDTLPDWKQSDFIKNIVNMFNARMYVDEINKKVYIKEYNSLYNSTALDWSNKLDKSKEISFTKYPAKQLYTYDFAKDDNDKLRKQRGKDEIKVTEGIDTEEITLDFGYFYMSDYFYSVFGIALPAMLQNVDNEVAMKSLPEKLTDIEPRVLLYASDSRTARTFFRLYTTYETNFAYAYQYLQSQSTPYNLTFEDLTQYDESGVNQGLLSRYYDNQTTVLNNSRVLTAYFTLNNKDVMNIINQVSNKDILTPIYINDNNYKGFYYISKIENYNPTNERPTKVELIEVTDKEINL